MNASPIRWYSINRDLAVEEHEPLELNEALKLIDRYLARGEEKFEAGEDALAATTLGFSRSASDFIEICVHGPDQIHYSFEMSDPNPSWLKKLLGNVFQYDEELHSREELIRKVEEFFTLSPQEIKRRIGR
jgi:hypothetical protein